MVLVFVAYFLALVGIAVVKARRMDAMSDYVLGGRRMSSITSGLSASVSATSGWTMLALPALAFTEGANILWLVGFLAVGSGSTGRSSPGGCAATPLPPTTR